MIGFSHAVVGGLIGAALPLPIALPLAIASHFVLDSLPHYGIPHARRDKSYFWKILFVVDFMATLSLSFIPLARTHYTIWLCGFAAVAPDFVWVAQVVKTKSFHLATRGNWYTRWHADIQRYERPWGIFIELPFAAIGLWLVLLYA